MAKIGVVGAGIIGRGWSIVFARAGHQVSLYDADGGVLDGAMTSIGRTLALLERGEPGFLAAPVIRRIDPCADLNALAHGAIYIQESIPEIAGLKTSLFLTLDRLAGPDTILASSTSALLPSSFLESVGGRHRCLVAHPMNPPHLVPLVELVPTRWTSPATVNACANLLRECGRTIIMVANEIPGFVVNRLQGALVAEAIRLVEKGVASAEDIDLCIRDGLGYRWAAGGPFDSMDLASKGGFAESARKYASMAGTLWPDAERWRPETIDEIDRWCRARHDLVRHESREQQRDAALIRIQQAREVDSRA